MLDLVRLVVGSDGANEGDGFFRGVDCAFELGFFYGVDLSRPRRLVGQVGSRRL